MNNWNHPAQFQFDSADLPFLPHSSAEPVSVESSTPFWKTSSITDRERSFISPDYLANKPMFRSPFMKLLSVSSQSHENIADSKEDLPKFSSSVPTKITAEQRRRLSQSLPATPLTTPGQTPLTTPVPTPQSSPMLHRKAEMEAVSKAALRCSNRLAQMQQKQPQRPQDAKWFYLGFMQNGVSGGDGSAAGCSMMMRSPRDVTAVNDAAGPLTTKPPNDVSVVEKTAKADAASSAVGREVIGDGMRRIQSDLGTSSCRRKCGFLMSNRDMNFLAPTSM